jgi:(p)ppGpp synthase/HD superfamily hydrolase
VHRGNCTYVEEEDPHRLVPVEWEREPQEVHEIEFSVLCQDKPGMLGSITAVLGEQHINITKLKAHSLANGNSLCVFRVTVKSLAELEALFAKVKRLSGVEKIERLQAS